MLQYILSHACTLHGEVDLFFYDESMEGMHVVCIYVVFLWSCLQTSEK